MPRPASAVTRRAVLLSGAGLTLALAGCGSRAYPKSGRLDEIRLGESAVRLAAREDAVRLQGSGSTPAWIYGDALFPVLRLKRGASLSVDLQNRLKEHTSIHWHGVRGPNAMDGVPYVTQMPVEPGEMFSYRFVPPDAGTYFFHPHCNTSEQLGRGLAGALIVEGDEEEPFDDDVVCLIKDWRLAKDGRFLPFLTLEGAGRAGSFGTLRTVNGQPAPEIQVPAGADIRLRMINADSSRVGDVGIMGADADAIAIDGNPIEPFRLDTWRLGPAMRLDLALRTPNDGGKVEIVDYFAAEPVVLATLVAQGARKRSGEFKVRPLKAHGLPEPGIAGVEMHQLKLSESAAATDYSQLPPIVLPDGHKIDLLDSLCSTARTLWAIDGRTWPQTGHEHLPPPLMEFKRGETAFVELQNTTPHVHPMHLHGHSFKVLAASKLKRPVHWADTVLVMPDERVQIAFVADNPGNWMIHCHIIEHQDTGMMGWFRVA
jgi:FtsP/CotA-like multicopper oxidase with cupredoxin domain